MTEEIKKCKDCLKQAKEIGAKNLEGYYKNHLVELKQQQKQLQKEKIKSLNKLKSKDFLPVKESIKFSLIVKEYLKEYQHSQLWLSKRLKISQQYIYFKLSNTMLFKIEEAEVIKKLMQKDKDKII